MKKKSIFFSLVICMILFLFSSCGQKELDLDVAVASLNTDELAHDRRPLRIAEVHAVGQGQRRGADRGQVAPCLGDR